MPSYLRLLICALSFFGWIAGFIDAAFTQSQQNPSPMVELIREHPRLEKVEPPGRRVPLSVGMLFIPPEIEVRAEGDSTPLVVAFHCGEWIPAIATSRLPDPLPCLSIQLGAGSARYAAPFEKDRELFSRLVKESARELNREISEIVLASWSAGYGAVGRILDQAEKPSKISAVLLIDGLHASYVDGKPGPEKSKLQTSSLQPFLRFARSAVQGECRLTVLHSEIFPGTYASTTETADWLLDELKIERRAILEWGPMKTQVLAENRAGGLIVRAFAGNSAPDHVDLLHALPEFLEEIFCR